MFEQLVRGIAEGLVPEDHAVKVDPVEMAQPGPQRQFLESEADITVYGGAAGGGKSYALLLDPLADSHNPGFGAVIFRRTLKQVKDQGGLWDTSEKIYPGLNADPNLTDRKWTFPSGAVVQFAGIEHEHDKLNWQGSQIALIGFDELTHFTEGQFFYLLSRNRSVCGARTRIRATTNPGPGWVKRLLAPWVDSKFTGKRAEPGEVRWFRRRHDKIVWLDEPPKIEPCDCLKEGCENCFPTAKSITFIPSRVWDNRKLLESNPQYVANLHTLAEHEQQALLHGDWDSVLPHRVIDAFDETSHVVPHREIPAHWLRAVGMDFGGINTAAVAIRIDPETEELWIVGEDWPGHSRTFDQIGKDVKAICGGMPHKGCGGNRTSEEGWRQAMRKEGIPMDAPQLGDPAIQYQCVNDAFRQGALKIFDTCEKTIGMLNTFQRKLDGNGMPTDEFKDTDFHLPAALRYIVSFLRPPKPKAADLEMW